MFSVIARPRLRRLALVAPFLILVLVVPSASICQELPGELEVLLSELPPRDSAGYTDLLEAAGKSPQYTPMTTLRMSGAELWSVEPQRAETLKQVAASHKVIVTMLDGAWNHVFQRMPHTTPMSPTQREMMNKAMQSKAAMGMSMMAIPPASMLEYAMTKGMHESKQGATAPSLIIQLNETTTVTARSTSISENEKGYVWRGTVEDSNDTVTLICWSGGSLTGTLTYKGRKYSVKNMGGGMYGVVEMDPTAMPPEHEPMGKPMSLDRNTTFDPLVKMGDASMLLDRHLRKEKPGSFNNEMNAPQYQNAPPPSFSGTTNTKLKAPIVISIIVAYTGAAAQNYADIERDLIWYAVEETNQSFRNSGIPNVEVQVAHVYQTNYLEKGGHFDHVFGLVYDNDGIMDEIHKLRDFHKADVGIVIVDDPKGCGLAAGVAPPEDRAFAAVHHECAATSYSLAHEIGHIIGARHNASLDDTQEPFPYGHGFIHGTDWRTMMSYEDSCKKCPRLLHWSNPNTQIGSVRAGDELSNNARVIREHSGRVAAFR